MPFPRHTEYVRHDCAGGMLPRGAARLMLRSPRRLPSRSDWVADAFVAIIIAVLLIAALAP